VIYAPKVATGLSPGVSTLGTLKINEFALKGREADLIKLAPIAAPKIEGAIETCYNCTYFRVVSTFDLPPLQGASLGRQFPGLKPWAESSRHFVPG
jgi:hypothetical protein